MGEIYTEVNGSTKANYDDEKIIEINWETKEIGEITAQPLIAGEKNSQYYKFRMGRFVDGIDLTEKKLKILYVGASNKGVAYAVNEEANEEKIIFGWIVPAEALENPGNLQFAIQVGDDEYILKTLSKTVEVLDGMREENILSDGGDE